MTWSVEWARSFVIAGKGIEQRFPVQNTQADALSCRSLFWLTFQLIFPRITSLFNEQMLASQDVGGGNATFSICSFFQQI